MIGLVRRYPLLSVLTLACAVAALVPLWASSQIPQAETPQHLALVDVLLHYDAPDGLYREHFERPGLFDAGTLYYVSCAALGHLMPIELGHKLLMSVYVLLFPLSVAFLLHAFGRPRRLALFAFFFVYGASFRDGVPGLLLAMPLFFFGVALVSMVARSPRRRSIVALALLSLGLFYAHVHLHVMFLVATFVVAGLRHRGWRGLVAALAAPALSALLLVVWAARVLPDEVLAGAHFAKPEEGMAQFAQGITSYFRDSGDEWFLLGAASLMAVGLVLRAHPASLPRRGEEATWRERHALELLTIVMGASVFLLPSRLDGRVPVAERNVLLFVLLMIPWMGWFRQRAAGATFAIALGVLVVGQFVYTTARFGEYDREVAGYVSLLKATPAQGLVAAVLPPKVESAVVDGPVMRNLHHLYTPIGGGLTELPVARSWRSPIRFRDDKAPPQLPERLTSSPRWKVYDYLYVHRSRLSHVEGQKVWLRLVEEHGDWLLFARRDRRFQAWWTLDGISPTAKDLLRAEERRERKRRRSNPAAPKELPNKGPRRDKRSFKPLSR